MQPNSFKKTEPSAPPELSLLIKEWEPAVGVEDVMTQDALIDEAVLIIKAAHDWMREYYTERGFDVPGADNPSHPISRAAVFLEQFE